MKLYMVRHGQSTANAAGLHSGWSQAPLTEQGEEDARRAGRVLKDISFDKVYVSDLLRAQQTLKIALSGVTGEATPLLREIDVGELAGKTAATCLEIYGERYCSDKVVRNFVPYGGEDDSMQTERIRKFAAQLEKNEQPYVAAFCHEGSIRCMLDLVMGQKHPRKEYPLNNGSVSIFAYTDGKWSLISWNQIAE